MKINNTVLLEYYSSMPSIYYSIVEHVLETIVKDQRKEFEIIDSNGVFKLGLKGNLFPFYSAFNMNDINDIINFINRGIIE